jgi:hypothetical protein
MIAAGGALMALPLALGLGMAAVLLGVGTGALAIALGLAGTAQGGRGTLPLSAHAGFDRALGAGLLALALAFRVAGERGGVALFGAIGLLMLVVSAGTRYTAPRAST